MVGSRTLTAVAGLAVSIALSAALYVYTGSVLFFLFVPFVPFLFKSHTEEKAERPPIRECDRCSFRTRDPEFEYCPHDGSRLHERREERS